ncbi:hypothetical protein D1867_04870 [Acidianus infernus]|uniref:Uncharacterized protein n=1 Tax=Acidianus infernus TaxID=12915 RepID=A0A6A9QH80_ACIIN|nr:hypothetical protein [Acidianus infernus]MCY0874267.1 hypothetical protein [Acidianus infernus]MCY0883997.1 hypothetical protein [Acidianus infernus]MUM64590.1 hypothetical protein [Acidianus infernus]
MRNYSGRSFNKERGQISQNEPKPLPLGEKCNYLCPYFRCNKRALMIQTKYVKGSPYKVGFCRWVGDTCITGECQYAYCEKRALLPGNRCAFAVNKRTDGDDMEKELKESDEYEDKVKDIISKKLGKKDLDLI